MTEDPSVKDVLSAAANIPKKAGKALLGAKVPVNGLRRFGQAVARQWLAIVLLAALFLWVLVDHLAMVEEVKKLTFAREHPPIENTAEPSTGLLSYNPAERSVARTEDDFIADRRKAADVAERSVVGAAFQEDNLIRSLFSSKAVGTGNQVDPEFDLFKYIDDNGLQGYEGEFIGSFNKTYADARLEDLRRKERNQETLAAAGWAGVLAVLAARFIDLPGLVLIGAFLWGRRPYAGTVSA